MVDAQDKVQGEGADHGGKELRTEKMARSRWGGGYSTSASSPLSGDTGSQDTHNSPRQELVPEGRPLLQAEKNTP